jgi:type II secretory pathway pseudopilin PulG
MRRISRRSRSRGYTVIEVMMAVILLVIGSAGIAAMQKAATFSNMRARQLAVASHIGQTWMERLRTDAINWTQPGLTNPQASNIGNTAWLGQVNAQPNVWFRPNDVPTRGSAGFDALGNDVPGSSAASAVYCTHLRLNWMYKLAPGGANNSGSQPELVRADVRVFWARDARQWTTAGLPNTGPVCAAGQNAPAIGAAANNAFAQYHFAYFTSAVPKNTAP